MHSFPARRVIVPASIMAVLAVLLIQRASAAATSCAFDAASATITVTVGPTGSTTVSRMVDTIAVDGAPCLDAVTTDVATVTTTDTITVTGTGEGNQLTIDLSGGAFAPGKTPEADAADSEIEWSVDLGPNGTVSVLGGAGNDAITVGADGINLNAVEALGDADVVLANTPVIGIDGGSGDDQLSAAGGQGTGATVGGVTLGGGDGDDFVDGGLGGDVLSGGEGTDTLDFRTATDGVQVDLLAGTATATGIDTVAEFENVKGSGFADNVMGDGGPNTISAGGGDDTIHGSAGADVIRGGDGLDAIYGGDDDDLLRGGTGKDQILGGAGQDLCAGGLEPDAWVECES
jgi:Ca2+-binding RTX toxin-like protein